MAQLKALDQKIGESGVKYYGVNETVVPDIELGWEHLVIYDGKKELNADLVGKNIHGEGAQKNKGNGSMNANYGSMAAGYNAYTSHGFSTALGNETVAYTNSLAAGFASYARAGSVALGVNAFAKDRSEAIGQYARADQEAIAIGYKATAGGFNRDEQTDKIPQAMTGIAIGEEAYAKGGMAFGNGAESLSLNAMAFGVRAKAIGSGIALGYQAQANVSGGIAIGMNSRAEVGRGIKGYLAPGDIDNQTDAEKRTWISGGSAVSFGNIKLTRQLMNVAAGLEDTDAVNVAQLKALNDKVDKSGVHYFSATSKKQEAGSNFANDGAKADDSMVVGISSVSNGVNSTVLGNNNTLTAKTGSRNNSIVVGQSIEVEGDQNAVFATEYQNNLDRRLTKVAGTRNTVVGIGNLAGYTAERDPNDRNKWIYTKWKDGLDSENVVFGLNNTANGGSIVVGSDSEVFGLGTSVGYHNKIIGDEDYGIALGNNLVVKGEQSIAIGSASETKAEYATAIGQEAIAEKAYSMAFGSSAKAENNYSVAIGAFADAKSRSGVAIGSSSLSDREKGIKGYLAGKDDESEIWKSTRGAVSVGNKEKKYTRQIIGVAAGSEDTDAVNVAQLKVVNDKADKNKTDITNLTNTVNNITQGTTDVSSWKLQANGANERTIKKDSVVNFKNGENTEVTVNGNDITVDLNAATKKQINDNTTNINNIDKRVTTIENNIDQKIEGAKITVKGDDKTGVKAEEVKTGDKVTGYKISLDNKVKVGNVTIDGTGEGTDSKGEITGLTNRTLDSGDFATKGRAATEEQLKAAMDQAVAQGTTTVKAGGQNISVVKTENKNEYTVSLAEDISVNRVTANEYKVGDKTYINDKGINANGNKITNVADGVVSKDSKDAVNGSQLYGVEQKVNQNTTNITNLQNNIYDMGTRVGELDNRMNKVGAGAAALAALHPQDFDPEDKWDIAAGVGNYKNATAAAVGLFYRPNERTMLNLGWTMGDSRNMVNAGVSVKLGSGNEYMKLSRAEMAQKLEEQNKEIREMKDTDRERDAQMQEVMKQLELLRKQVEK